MRRLSVVLLALFALALPTVASAGFSDGGDQPTTTPWVTVSPFMPQPYQVVDEYGCGYTGSYYLNEVYIGRDGGGAASYVSRTPDANGCVDWDYGQVFDAGHYIAYTYVRLNAPGHPTVVLAKYEFDVGYPCSEGCLSWWEGP